MTDTKTTKDPRQTDEAASHAQVIEGLGELADFLADAGPGSGLIDWHASAEVHRCVGDDEGDALTRVKLLLAIAETIGVEVTSSVSRANGAVHYHAHREFGGGAVVYDAFTIVDEAEVEKAQTALAEATRYLAAEAWEAAVTPSAAATEPVPEPGLHVNYFVEHEPAVVDEVKAAFREHGIHACTSVTVAEEFADGSVRPLEDEAGTFGVLLEAVNTEYPDDPVWEVVYPPVESYPTIGDYVGAIARTLKRELPENHDQPGICNHIAETAVRGIHADGRVRTVYANRAHLERVRLELASMGFVTVELTGYDREFETWAEDLPVCGVTAEEVLPL